MDPIMKVTLENLSLNGTTHLPTGIQLIHRLQRIVPGKGLVKLGMHVCLQFPIHF